jgi:hypothetical protein
LRVRLPLAANDPAGEWKVVVRELLNNGADSLPFRYEAPKRAGALVGATRRAVSFDNDQDNILRFARVHRSVTIVKGTSPHNDAAAKRLASILKPWGVECKEMALAEAAKPRSLSEEEARTWCGLGYAASGQIKPGAGNAPVLVGFAVRGPVILLGTPEDNLLIKFLAEQQFLPYRPDAHDFPGVGRGLIAWQREGVGRGQESVTLIAYDEAGMSEAVGSLYQAVAGQEPLTKWRLPETASHTSARSAPDLGAAAAVSGGGKLAVAYWGGTLRIADPGGKILAEQQLPQDVTGMTWLGGKLVAGLADGRVVALTVK